MEQELDKQIDQQIENVSVLLDTVTQFLVTYGFQIVGAIIVLIVGLKVSNWSARRTTDLALARHIDQTLAKFLGNVVKVLMIGIVIVITLSNFGITIAPLVALAGAVAFGSTIAIQGPLSNYGAGLSIILTRPFVVGNTVRIKGTYGVVEDIRLAVTVLRGEDGEQITIPNKEIVGQIIVNSHAYRIVEPRIFLRAGQEVEKAVAVIKATISEFATTEDAPSPQVGVQDFAYGGTVIGARYWVPSLTYFRKRYEINRAILKALEDAGIELTVAGAAALAAPALSAEDEEEPAV